MLSSLSQIDQANAQELESLTTPLTASGAVLGIDQQHRLQAVQGRPWAVDVSVSVSTSAREVLRLHRFEIELPSGRRLEARTRGVTSHADGSISWTGTIDGSESLTSIVADEAGLVGSIRDGDRTFVFEALGDDATAIYRLRYDQLPKDHPSTEAAPATAAAPVMEKSTSTSSGGSVVDALVVYTPAASSGMGSLVAVAEADLNDIHSNSSAASTGDVVHHEVISYSESGLLATDLARLMGTSDGYLDSVHSLRDNVGADVVVLVVDTGDGCGLAGSIGATASNAFAVVKKSCNRVKVLGCPRVGSPCRCAT